MDRSIGAWGVLLRAFPDRETETLTILVHLDRLRRATERAFPSARAFVRPGWDTETITDTRLQNRRRWRFHGDIDHR